MNLTDIKDKLLKGWFVLSALALAIMYFILDRRGRALSKAIQDAQNQLLGQELKRIKEKSKRSNEEFDESSKEYEALKRRHGDLLQRIGFSERAAEPNAQGNTKPNRTSEDL